MIRFYTSRKIQIGNVCFYLDAEEMAWLSQQPISACLLLFIKIIRWWNCPPRLKTIILAQLIEDLALPTWDKEYGQGQHLCKLQAIACILSLV